MMRIPDIERVRRQRSIYIVQSQHLNGIEEHLAAMLEGKVFFDLASSY